MPRIWDWTITAVLLICAVSTTALVIYRASNPSTADQKASEGDKLTLEPRWKSLVGQGARIGPQNAPIQIVEFGDFECPFCAQFHDVFSKLSGKHPGKISLTFINYPLPSHRFALEAARASECADQQGRFTEMSDLLFKQQAELDGRPWAALALKAGVPGSQEFASCMKNPASDDRIHAHKRVVEQFNVTATPTILINGWRLTGANERRINDIADRILKGESPQ